MLFYWVQGLQHKIKLVPLNLINRPDWYKEKVYPMNKVIHVEENHILVPCFICPFFVC